MLNAITFSVFITIAVFLIAILQLLLQFISVKISWSFIALKQFMHRFAKTIPWLSFPFGIVIGNGKYLPVENLKLYWGVCLSSFIFVFALFFIMNYLSYRKSGSLSFFRPSASSYLTGLLVGISIHLIF